MIAIHLDGRKMELPGGSTLSSVLAGHPPDCAVGIIRPATQEQMQTANLAIATTAGEITVEVAGQEGSSVFSAPDITGRLTLHWADRYAAAFGPFPTSIKPSRKPRVYERGDVILGCGGDEPGPVVPDPGQDPARGRPRRR